jgi:hypothetical protein
MAFSEAEMSAHRKEMDGYMAWRRPDEEIRDQVDVSYRIEGQSVEIFTIRPNWQKPAESTETPIAKATYVGTQKVWRVFWMRADLKWHSYPDAPRVRRLSDFLKHVESDRLGCFWG